jgi:imidazolonepropionase-like amidohydrolase
LYLPAGKVALHQGGALPDMATTRVAPAGGVGLLLRGSDVEALYKMEYCTCYGAPPRPGAAPYDPIIGVRVPKRATEALARFVGLSVQLDNFDAAQASAVLSAILNTEMGVGAP